MSNASEEVVCQYFHAPVNTIGESKEIVSRRIYFKMRRLLYVLIVAA